MVTETITLLRREYDRLRHAERRFTEEYETKAAEMRRLVNQAHSQLGAATRDIDKLRARIEELEAALQSPPVTESVTNRD